MIIENVPIKDLNPSKDQVRITFNEERMDALALSLKEQGQEVPIKVRPNGKGYEIIYGHRRAEASKRAGLKTIVAIVEDVDDVEALRKQVLENECREDVDDVERIRGYKKLLDAGCTTSQVDEMSGHASGYVKRLLEMLKEIDRGVKVINSGKVSISKTQEVLRVDGGVNEKKKVASKLSSEELSRRQAREVVKAYNAASTAKEKEMVLQVRHPKRRDWSLNDELLFVGRVTKSRDKKLKRAELTDDPIVKNYLDAMKVYRDAIKQASASPRRFSPEAVRFIDRRHNIISKEMLTLKEVLSNA